MAPTAPPVADANVDAGIAQVYEYGESGRREIALTFDAGADRGYAEEILDLLQAEGIQASFGIMGGWNQGQAHAQFVSNIVDHGLTLQQALEAGRFTKGTFEGCDVDVETLVPEATRRALTARGHVIKVVEPRTGTFGFGQAVMSGAGGVHFGASEPRHDGAAIPQAPPVFTVSPQPE